jgi:hypothetical protein
MAQCCEKMSIIEEGWVSNEDHEVTRTQLKTVREESRKACEGDG